MDRVGSAIIDFTEAAYDLELSGEEWLPTVLKRGLPFLEHGLGVAGMRYGRPPDGGPFQILDIHVASGPKDFAERHTRALATTPPEVLRQQVRPGRAGTASGQDDVSLEEIAHYTSHVDYCKDLLTITAVDCKGSGVAIVAPLAEVTALSGHDAQRWEMLAAHVDAGHRLRQAVSAYEAGDEPCPDLPHDTDPEKALEIWKALVRGRWSTVSTRTADASCWPSQTPPVSATRAGLANAKARSWHTRCWVKPTR